MPIHTEDLEYLQLRGAAPLLARFYRPEGAGPFPAVLEVHRRAWTAGDRLNNVGTVCDAQCTGRGSRHILGRTSAAAQRAAPHDPRYAALPLVGADAKPGVRGRLLASGRSARSLSRGNERLSDAHHQFWPSEEAMAEGNPQLILERGEPVEKPPGADHAGHRRR